MSVPVPAWTRWVDGGRALAAVTDVPSNATTATAEIDPASFVRTALPLRGHAASRAGRYNHYLQLSTTETEAYGSGRVGVGTSLDSKSPTTSAGWRTPARPSADRCQGGGPSVLTWKLGSSPRRTPNAAEGIFAKRQADEGSSTN
jgi:hypothetical protein